MAKIENVVEGVAQPVEPPTPAAAATPGVTYVTDSRGRRIGLKKLKPSERFKLSEAIDTKTQSGELQKIVVATVVSIDDEAFPPLKDKAGLLNRLDEIGDEGLAAITKPVLEIYGFNFDQADIDLAKNS
jgi:hypothetical protein